MDVTIVGSITQVWSEIMTWITESIGSVQSIFFNPSSGLTFLGVLSVISLAIGITFLVIGVITNFLKLRS